jgi:glycosyltransferase involved in cell wall biosynthesis
MPAFNPGQYFSEAVQSVVEQTFEDWELIVVDDASSEDLAPPLSKYEKVRLIRLPHSGPSIARNAGILSSRSEFVAFLDADDVWLPGLLEHQVRALESAPETALCYVDCDVVNAKGDRIGEMISPENGSYLSLLAGGLVPTPSAVMLRRHCLAASGLFDPLRKFCEDNDMWLRIAKFHGILHIPYKGVIYRRHNNNRSNATLANFADMIDIYRRHERQAKQSGNRPALKAIKEGMVLARHHVGASEFDSCRSSLHAGRLGAAISHFRNALLFNPSLVLRSIRSWIKIHFGAPIKSRI